MFIFSLERSQTRGLLAMSSLAGANVGVLDEDELVDQAVVVDLPRRAEVREGRGREEREERRRGREYQSYFCV